MSAESDWVVHGRDLQPMRTDIGKLDSRVGYLSETIVTLTDAVSELHANIVPGLRSSWAYKIAFTALVAGFVGAVFGVLTTHAMISDAVAAEVRKR